MTLTLIRHARAAERGADYPDDSLRPLVVKGHQQAQTLAGVFKQLGIAFDGLYSSPYTRAMQTAEPLLPCLKRGKLQTLPSLTGDHYPQVLVDIGDNVDAPHLALVGHEPHLSELASYLLSGNPVRVAVAFKKAAFMQLTGTLEPGSMTLSTLLPYSVYKHLAPA